MGQAVPVEILKYLVIRFIMWQKRPGNSHLSSDITQFFIEPVCTNHESASSPEATTLGDIHFFEGFDTKTFEYFLTQCELPELKKIVVDA